MRLRTHDELSLSAVWGGSLTEQSPNKLYVTDKGSLLQAFHEVVHLAKYPYFTGSPTPTTR